MDYAELPLPPAFAGMVAAVWTVSVDAEDWVEREATPDGCIELIRRHSGRSIWRAEQPELFATGLAHRPAQLRFSGDARFTGIKLWPWAWHALGGAPCTRFADSWVPVDPASPLALLLPAEGDVMERLTSALAPHPLPDIGRAILSAASPGDLVRATGLPPRQLQRHFARAFGMSPRAYLRLLRFRGALIDLQQGDDTLAGTAATQGYADQAHMAREFRALAGVPPRDARKRARGPFL